MHFFSLLAWTNILLQCGEYNKQTSHSQWKVLWHVLKWSWYCRNSVELKMTSGISILTTVHAASTHRDHKTPNSMMPTHLYNWQRPLLPLPKCACSSSMLSAVNGSIELLTVTLHNHCLVLKLSVPTRSVVMPTYWLDRSLQRLLMESFSFIASWQIWKSVCPCMVSKTKTIERFTAHNDIDLTILLYTIKFWGLGRLFNLFYRGRVS